MERPIIHSGEPFDWDSPKPDVVDDDGNVNWRAAMMADPGVMSCPACEAHLWAEGHEVECPHCGHRWTRGA